MKINHGHRSSFGSSAFDSSAFVAKNLSCQNNERNLKVICHTFSEI